MPVNTTDQEITLPIGADAADNPVAFVNQTMDIESRLALRYTDEVDRAARHPVGIEGEVSHLSVSDRLETYDGANWVSLFSRSFYTFARKSANQALTLSSTALQNVTSLLSALPATGVFGFAGVVFYDTSAVADLKLAFTIPAGATMEWGLMGAATAGGGSGDGTFLTATASAAAIPVGGAGVGTGLWAQIEGEVNTTGTAGNLQLQAAQNTSDATQSTIRSRSRLRVWRIS